jgi:hypothetical protein
VVDRPNAITGLQFFQRASFETAYAKREVLVDFRERREMVQLVLRLKGYLIERHDGRVSRTLEEIVEDSYADETR